MIDLYYARLVYLRDRYRLAAITGMPRETAHALREWIAVAEEAAAYLEEDPRSSTTCQDFLAASERTTP